MGSSCWSPSFSCLDSLETSFRPSPSEGHPYPHQVHWQSHHPVALQGHCQGGAWLSLASPSAYIHNHHGDHHTPHAECSTLGPGVVVVTGPLGRESPHCQKKWSSGGKQGGVGLGYCCISFSSIHQVLAIKARTDLWRDKPQQCSHHQIGAHRGTSHPPERRGHFSL